MKACLFGEFPSGKDPDELIRQDAEIWKTVITKNQYALDWLIERYQSLLDVTSAQGKREFSSVLLPVVRELTDSVEQDHYLGRIADIIGVRREALDDKYETTTSEAPVQPRRQMAASEPDDRSTTDSVRAQDQLLALALLQPALRRYLEPLTEEMLLSADGRELLKFLKENPDFDGKTSTQNETLKPLRDYAKGLSLVYDELYGGVEPADLVGDAARQQTRLIRRYVDVRGAELRKQMDGADDVTSRQLLEQMVALNNLLR